MFTWRELTEDLHRASKGNFVYTIGARNGDFHYVLEVCHEFICKDGPYSFEVAKSKAEDDYVARIAHAQKVMECGCYRPIAPDSGVRNGNIRQWERKHMGSDLFKSALPHLFRQTP